MATSYTTLLGLALPVQGELQGTWGDEVNNYITNYLDAAVAGTQNISTDADVTLTKTTGTALTSTSSQYSILLFSGSRAAQRTVTVPAASRSYVVINATTGGFAVKVVGVGPTTGVTIANGEKAVIAWNGSDFIKVSTFGGDPTFGNVTVTGTTTLSGLTASTALALNASKEVVSVTNTGTGNNVLSASPTLTGTISAAAATLSGNLTLSGGTANGVLYLDGSKVATSGSALTFDGTTLGAPQVLLPNGNSYQIKSAAGVASAVLGMDASNNLYLGASGAVATNIFYTGGSEQMRLTSTGLGIGTSSPLTKLDIKFAADKHALFLASSSYSNGADLVATNDTGSEIALGLGGNTVRFYTGATERMRLDSSGNLGLGVTPSAWFASNNTKAMQLGGGSFVSYLNNQVWLANNYFLNSSGQDTYVNNGTAMRLIMDGAYKFQIAPSGTAGNTISFTQAMTLDASGNLGVGTTSPGNRLHVSASDGDVARIAGTTRSLYFGADGGGMMIATGAGQTGVGTYYSAGSDFMYFMTGSTERARLDSSGNLGLGVTPSAWDSSTLTALQVRSASISSIPSGANDSYFSSNAFYNASWKYITTSFATQYRQANGIHSWYTAPSGTAGNAISFTQAMTLDASGNLGVGTTSPNARLEIVEYNNSESGNSAAIIIKSDHGLGEDGSISKLIFAGANRPNGFAKISASGSDYNSGNGNMRFYTATGGALTERARITSGGNFKIGGTADRATTEGDKQLVLFNGTAPVGTLANGISIYSSSGEAYVMDAAGNATLFSPHDAETNEWIFRSKHTPTGKVLKIDVERLLKFVNDHFGLDAVHEFIEP